MPVAFGTKRSYQPSEVLAALRPREQEEYELLGKDIATHMRELKAMRQRRERLYQVAVTRIRDADPVRRAIKSMQRKLLRDHP